MSYFMANVVEGKVIPKNFGNISHLPGSKMIDDYDKLLGQQETDWLTVRRKNYKDLVIVTEKVDGMNAGVLKRNGRLYPIMRAGYDVRTSNTEWIRNFGDYVYFNAPRFIDLLEDGERICGEWMIKTHTLRYNLKTEPFIPFDIIAGDNSRPRYKDFYRRVTNLGFTPAGIIHIGEAIPPLMAVQIAGKGYHGVIGDEIEGVVYRYESWENGFVCSGKYVSNRNVGNNEIFEHNMDENVFNIVKSVYKRFIPAQMPVG